MFGTARISHCHIRESVYREALRRCSLPHRRNRLADAAFLAATQEKLSIVFGTGLHFSLPHKRIFLSVAPAAAFTATEVTCVLVVFTAT